MSFLEELLAPQRRGWVHTNVFFKPGAPPNIEPHGLAKVFSPGWNLPAENNQSIVPLVFEPESPPNLIKNAFCYSYICYNFVFPPFFRTHLSPLLSLFLKTKSSGFSVKRGLASFQSSELSSME